MQLLKIKYLITEKNFSQNNCESNVLNIYITCSLGSKELILKRASSESKIVEKTLRAGCEGRKRREKEGGKGGDDGADGWVDLFSAIHKINDRYLIFYSLLLYNCEAVCDRYLELTHTTFVV